MKITITTWNIESGLRLAMDALHRVHQITEDLRNILEELPEAIAVTWKLTGSTLEILVETV